MHLAISSNKCKNTIQNVMQFQGDSYLFQEVGGVRLEEQTSKVFH